MTVSERNKRIAYLLKRKEALTWKWIGACEEINAQLETLKATPTEGDTDESSTEDQTATDSEDENGRHESVLRSC